MFIGTANGLLDVVDGTVIGVLAVLEGATGVLMRVGGREREGIGTGIAGVFLPLCEPEWVTSEGTGTVIG